MSRALQTGEGWGPLQTRPSPRGLLYVKFDSVCDKIQTVFLVRRLHPQRTEGALHSSVYSSVPELSSK